MRDYLHVYGSGDWASCGLDQLELNPGLMEHNPGTGNGYTVPGVIETFSKTSGQDISYEFMTHKAGDITKAWVDTGLAEPALGWKAECALDEMRRDA
ncbi:hypothetical protein ACFL1J_00970 [Pseudomonadota bacterium]